MWIRVVRVSDGLVGTGAQAIPMGPEPEFLVIRATARAPFVAMGSEGTLTVRQRLASAMVGATPRSLSSRRSFIILFYDCDAKMSATRTVAGRTAAHVRRRVRGTAAVRLPLTMWQ